MKDATEARSAALTSAGSFIPKFLKQADFPAAGRDVMRLASRRGAPKGVIEMLRGLTPSKMFHNGYEVWCDARRG